jgi:hypothetical protein
MSNKIKAQLKEVEKEYELTDYEFNFLKVLNVSLAFNVNHENLLSGFLNYVATGRLAHKTTAGYGLQFMIDLGSDNKTLVVKEAKATNE